MPPRWGRSGKRATPSVDVRFDDGGALTLLQTGAWDELVVQWETEPDTDRVGSWRVEGEQVSFWLEHNGLKRDDVVLDAGRIYCKAGAWGSTLGRRGNLSIKQAKFGWMPFLPSPSQASFLVGTFRTSPIHTSDEADGCGDDNVSEFGDVEIQKP
jgi:hypothetical protein